MCGCKLCLWGFLLNRFVVFGLLGVVCVFLVWVFVFVVFVRSVKFWLLVCFL